jgi:hypothetical protein
MTQTLSSDIKKMAVKSNHTIVIMLVTAKILTAYDRMPTRFSRRTKTKQKLDPRGITCQRDACKKLNCKLENLSAIKEKAAKNH